MTLCTPAAASPVHASSLGNTRTPSLRVIGTLLLTGLCLVVGVPDPASAQHSGTHAGTHAPSAQHSGPHAASTASSVDNLLDFRHGITPSLLQDHLMIFASDEMMGRETATEHERKASAWLSERYAELGLMPMGPDGSYLQPFELTATVTDSLVFDLAGGAASRTVIREGAGVDPSFRLMFGGTDPQQAEIVFAGFGVEDAEKAILHLEGTDLNGRWVMVFSRIPNEHQGRELIARNVTNNIRVGNLLSQKGAAGVLLISDQEPEAFAASALAGAAIVSKPTNMRLTYRGDAGFRGFRGAVAEIRGDAAARILGVEDLAAYQASILDDMASDKPSFRARATGHTLSFTPHRREVTLISSNVVAMLEGSDPLLKDEVVVLTSHYDHIGVTLPDSTGDAINNGADDDGSGTIGLLGVATAMSQAAAEGHRPRRSVLFLHVSAEEKGLLGSRYYSDHPLVPIEKTIANLNADMIGRSDASHLSEGVTDYVYLIGGPIISSGLDSLVTEANRKSSGILLDYAYNDLEDPNQFYRRSDHWNFGRLGIPFSFFFTGVHEDYHRPSDHPEKIDYGKLSKISQLIYAATVELANHPDRPVVDNQAFIEKTRQMPR